MDLEASKIVGKQWNGLLNFGYSHPLMKSENDGNSIFLALEEMMLLSDIY